MSGKNFVFSDDPIIHNGRRFYLRTKFGRRGSTCVFSIRTQARGKGVRLATVSGIIRDDSDQIKLLNRLKKKMNFQYLMLVDVAPLVTK